MKIPATRRWYRVCAALSAVLFTGVIAGCAWLSPMAALAQRTDEDPDEVVYFQAQMAVDASDFDAAIQLLEGRASRSGAPAELLVLLAQAQIGNRDLDAAEKTLTEAIKRYPSYIPARELRASVYRRKGLKDQSIADLEGALAIVPQNSDLLETLASLRLRSLERWDLGPDNPDLQKTIELYERLAEVRSGSQKITPLIILASIYSRVGQTDRAIEYAAQATRLRSHDLRAQLTLASVYEEAGRPKDALESYRQSLLIDPTNTVIRAKIAELVRASQLEGGTLRFYSDLAAEFPGVREIQELYADELIAAKEWDKAIDLYRTLLARYEGDRGLKAGLVRALLAGGHDDEAMALMSQIIEDEGTDTQTLLGLTDALRSQGKLDQVTSLLKKARESGNSDMRLALALAQVQVQSGQMSEAVRTLEEISRDGSAPFPVVMLLADLYSDEGRYDDARKLLESIDAETRSGREIEIQLRLANLYRLEKKPGEAAKILEGLLDKTDPPSEVALRLLVETYNDMGEQEKAMQVLDRVIASTSDEANRNARGVKAWLLWKNRKYKESIDILEELHVEDAGNFTTLQLLVENYAKTGELDKAEGLMQAAATRIPGDMDDDYLILRARLFHLQNRNDQAAETAEKLLERQKDNDDYLMIAGEYYYEAGRLEDAERVLRKAIDLDPNNAEAYNALGYFLAEAGIKLDDALQLIQKALELEPDAGHMVDSLGWVHYMQGNYDAAVSDLERAVEMMKDSPDPVVYTHLGDAYAGAGRAEDARAAYEKALKLDPDSKEVQNKLKKVL